MGDRILRPLFYSGWMLVNLLQAATTGLLDDEAYYWIYSRFPAWGYYDHPPMIAALIKAGYALFPSELGVRFFIVCMSTVTLWMIDRLCTKRNDRLFFALAMSMFLLQIGSMIAVPDLPLMFFIALYFTVYKAFLKKTDLIHAVLLGIVIACMLYSKYHGILVVLFTLVANPGLLKRWPTYLAAGVAALLFLPHGLWQINHGFPSLSYHLFERNATQYQFEFTVQYLLGQLLMAGPLIGWIILISAWRKKHEDAFEKTLKWSSWGIMMLFFTATLKGRSEANWTVPAFVGLIVLAHQHLVESPILRRWLYRLFIPSLLLILITRIYMMLDVQPLTWLKKDEFHKTKEWAVAIRDSAKDLPVVFPNSYQRASQYWFYTGDTSFALNCIQYRRSNYNLWPLEQQLQGKKLMLVYPDSSDYFRNGLPNARKRMYYAIADSFFSYSRIGIRELGKPEIRGFQWRSTISAWGYQERIEKNAQIYLVLYAHDNDVAYLMPAAVGLQELTEASGPIVARVDINTVRPGKYRYKWAIESAVPAWPTLNSTSAEVVIP